MEGGNTIGNTSMWLTIARRSSSSNCNSLMSLAWSSGWTASWIAPAAAAAGRRKKSIRQRNNLPIFLLSFTIVEAMAWIYVEGALRYGAEDMCSSAMYGWRLLVATSKASIGVLTVSSRTYNDIKKVFLLNRKLKNKIELKKRQQQEDSTKTFH